MPRYFSPTEEDLKVRWRVPMYISPHEIKRFREKFQKCIHSYDGEDHRSRFTRVGFCSNPERKGIIVHRFINEGIMVYHNCHKCKEFKKKKEEER